MVYWYTASFESCNYKSWETVNKKNILNSKNKQNLHFLMNTLRQLLQISLYCTQNELPKEKEMYEMILSILMRIPVMVKVLSHRHAGVFLPQSSLFGGDFCNSRCEECLYLLLSTSCPSCLFCLTLV